MKAWREIAIPHEDVRKGSFKQAEFAADLTLVHNGKASAEYAKPELFFARTFITEGMRLLLDSVIKRLNGLGGDPVIQLQTAFGGGKTHTMLAVYHLAKGACPLSHLQGIPSIIDKAGVTGIPSTRVVVLDGNQLSPNNPRRHGSLSVNTLWGELAWQLGGENGYEIVKQADLSGTSPGKEDITELLQQYAPCVILIDELVAYIRQFEDGKTYSGGTFDSNLSFIQALTEGLKAVPTALMLASLPESDKEAGSNRGKSVLTTLEHYFGRLQSLWKPVGTEEAFEIVRRRLFENITDEAAMEEVCKSFADFYINQNAEFPSETQETRYLHRLRQAYPIHPEVFDRLYEDWSSLETFQRTRGVLKLMAKVIYRLWTDDNKDALIMPGNFPLFDGDVRNEAIYYLPQGWDPVVERDIDGQRSETSEIEKGEPRFGQIHACRRLARTIFLGSAPHAGAMQGSRTTRGIDRKHIMLGCLQPDPQQLGIFRDALKRMADRLHHMDNADNDRFWFDTRPNLRREMEERKARFNDRDDVFPVYRDMLQKLLPSGTFDAVHVFTPSEDIPDDYQLRLIVLHPTSYHLRSGKCFAIDGQQDGSHGARRILEKRGENPRLRQNRLVFLAADGESLRKLNEQVRIILAWDSIVKDAQTMKLNLDAYQTRQAKDGHENAKRALERLIREVYKWLLVPEMTEQAKEPTWQQFQLNTSSSSFLSDIEKILKDNELLILQWAPIHLSNLLKKWFWGSGETVCKAQEVWQKMGCLLYLPRLRSESVFSDAMSAGAASRDFFGFASGKEEEKYVGFSFGSPYSPILDSTLLLIDPKAAAEIEAVIIASKPTFPVTPTEQTGSKPPVGNSTQIESEEPQGASRQGSSTSPQLKSLFFGRIELSPAKAKSDFINVVDEVLDHLVKNPGTKVTIKLEIEAECSQGFGESLQRTIKENCNTLKFDNAEFE
jgi:predicted AAA+ superfamily ATPase